MIYLVAMVAVFVGGTAMAQPLQPGSRYVAMGNSYAAGPGVGTHESSIPSRQRSLNNCAHLVAAKRHLTLLDVSCSGAATNNILVHGQHGLPAQIEAMTSDTRLVSVLIGGNDIQYVGNLLGLSCRDAGGGHCHVVDPAGVQRRMAALPTSIDQVLVEVRERAPRARIVLVGYLPAVPAEGPGTCSAVPLTAEDATRVRGVAIRLAQIIGGAAR